MALQWAAAAFLGGELSISYGGAVHPLEPAAEFRPEALKVACDLALTEEAAGKTIVVMQASHGIRYVNHPMWAAVKKEATLALPSPPNMDKEAETVLWKSSDYTPAE